MKYLLHFKVVEIGIKVIEVFLQRDRTGCHLSVIVGQVDNARPKGHFDFDKRLIAIGKKVLGLARVYANDAEQQMS